MTIWLGCGPTSSRVHSIENKTICVLLHLRLKCSHIINSHACKQTNNLSWTLRSFSYLRYHMICPCSAGDIFHLWYLRCVWMLRPDSQPDRLRSWPPALKPVNRLRSQLTRFMAKLICWPVSKPRGQLAQWLRAGTMPHSASLYVL